MELYSFGYDTRTRLPTSLIEYAERQPVLEAKKIKVFWSSWCDTVITHQNEDKQWHTRYTGTGLTTGQSDYMTQHRIHGGVVLHARSSYFGTAMHDGLMGYMFTADKARAGFCDFIFLSTESELQEDEKLAHLRFYHWYNDCNILDLKVMSDGHVLLHTKTATSGDEKVIDVHTMKTFLSYLDQEAIPDSLTGEPLFSGTPVQWVVNATTSTILDQNGTVYTSTRDPRYPKCLGRPYENTPRFEPVSYLSETRIKKIASGGYMSAAVSVGGELFMWGQACPGSKGALEVLAEKDIVLETHGKDPDPRMTRISAGGEQDEWVKYLAVQINGQDACVYDIAIGHGHILVAVSLGHSDRPTQHVTFAAGDNSKGQTGHDGESIFLTNFKEVLPLRGKRIKQLAAAGWSSNVVVYKA